MAMMIMKMRMIMMTITIIMIMMMTIVMMTSKDDGNCYGSLLQEAISLVAKGG